MAPQAYAAVEQRAQQLDLVEVQEEEDIGEEGHGCCSSWTTNEGVMQAQGLASALRPTRLQCLCYKHQRVRGVWGSASLRLLAVDAPTVDIGEQR